MGHSEALYAIGRFPFADAAEIATFASLVEVTFRQHVLKAQEEGLVASLSHASPLTARTGRLTLTAEGMAALGERGSYLWLSRHIQRYMLRRLDPLAVIYRTLEGICELLSEAVIEFSYHTRGNLDAAAKMESGVSLGFVRQGALWGREPFANRIIRAGAGILSPDIILALTPNVIELDRLRERMNFEAYPTILGAEEAAATVYRDALWRRVNGADESLSLDEALGSIDVYGWMPDPPDAKGAPFPASYWPPDDVPSVSLHARQKALLDMIGRWPRITQADLSDMAGASERVLQRWLNHPDMRRLYERGRYGRRLTYTLSAEGVRYIANRDRNHVATALAAWDPSDGKRVVFTDSQAEHSDGIHRAVSLIAKAARASSVWTLETLEPDWRSARTWYNLDGGRRLLQPDAMGVLNIPAEHRQPFLLEYERRTRYRSHSGARVSKYLDYYRTGGWRQHWEDEPLTLFVFDDTGMETTFLRATGELLSASRLRTTCMQTLEEAGALGYAWRIPGRNYELTRL